MVALRKESVDRNSVPFRPASHLSVALRKESVDRNVGDSQSVGIVTVALRKESVDRNEDHCAIRQQGQRSLSARRAWIEIGRAAGHRLYRRGRSPQGERG